VQTHFCFALSTEFFLYSQKFHSLAGVEALKSEGEYLEQLEDLALSVVVLASLPSPQPSLKILEMFVFQYSTTHLSSSCERKITWNAISILLHRTIQTPWPLGKK
jgi:hypothetical protein